MSETDTNLVDFEVLEHLLMATRTPYSPAFIHGMMLGVLCAAKESVEKCWQRIEEELPFIADSEQTQNRLFKSLFSNSVIMLNDFESGVVLLLPPDEAPLKYRLEALGRWCEGFLCGIELADLADGVYKLPTIKEVLEDFMLIKDVSLDESNTHTNEKSYCDIVEFARVGALLIHAECAPLSFEKMTRSREQTLH